ncbi:MAG: putative collagen-binding domain-containing protein [Candidatus Hydrogenedentales bacterium]|jgi:hypothetical protein
MRAVQKIRWYSVRWMVLALGLSAGAFLAVSAWAEGPEEGGALAASPGGHFVHYDGATRMLIGDSGTQCVLQNLNVDYRRWIDDCAERGLTAIHVWALLAPRQTADGAIVEERYGYVYPGATPWARNAQGAPAADGGPPWDLTRFDEGDDPNRHYWPRLRDCCAYARARGLVAGITVFFGWPKHNYPEQPDWLFHPFNVRNGGFLTEKRRITEAAQMIHSPGHEVLEEAWNEAWPADKKTQWVWERFADKLLRETQPFGNVFFVFMDEHSYSEGNCGDHFQAFFKKRQAFYSDWDRRRGGVDLVHEDVRADSGDANRAAEKLFFREPVRPNIALEAPPYQGDVVRRSIWSRVIAGHHYLFHNDAEQETPQTGIMVYDPNVDGGNLEKVHERLDWLGHASRFFNRELANLDAMAPHNELVQGAEPVYCFAEPGREYAVFSWQGERFELDLSAAAGKAVTARFYSPRDGSWRAATEEAAGTVTYHKPDPQDWVLHVRVAE